MEENSKVVTAHVDTTDPSAGIQSGNMHETNPVEQAPKNEAIPEKFQGAEDPVAAMAQAYRELEKKLGHKLPDESKPPELRGKDLTDGDDTQEAEGETEGQTEADTREGYRIATAEDNVSYGEAFDASIEKAGLKPMDLHNEWVRTGDISADTKAALEKGGIPSAVVEQYVKGFNADVSSNQADVDSITDAEIAAVQQVAGGEEGYKDLLQWAGANLSQDEAVAFNDAVTGSSPAMAKLAVEGLIARRASTTGDDTGLILGHGNGRGTNEGFSSHHEQQQAWQKAQQSRDPKVYEEYTRRALASRF